MEKEKEISEAIAWYSKTNMLIEKELEFSVIENEITDAKNHRLSVLKDALNQFPDKIKPIDPNSLKPNELEIFINENFEFQKQIIKEILF